MRNDADRNTERLSSLPDLEWSEPVDVHLWQPGFDAFNHSCIEVAGELRMDPTLRV